MTKKTLKLQLEQLNFTVGDIEGNYQKIVASYQNAKNNEVDLVIFSELAICGYNPEDLLQKPYFIEECGEKIKDLCKITKGQKAAILVGAPASFTDRFGKKSLYNAAFLIENGEVEAIIRKNTLPNYGVFDEKRYFHAGATLTCHNFRGFELAILICEDMWNMKNAYLLAEQNIDAIISINASPFVKNKAEQRIEHAHKFVENIKKPLIYVNQIGAQDAVIFDGSSFIVNGEDETCLYLKEFLEDSALIKICKEGKKISVEQGSSHQIKSSKESRIYNAIILGIRDYMKKNNFTQAILGMSGGIDSAIVAALAVDALGCENVKLVAMPSRFNSTQSKTDAEICSNNLGIKMDIISIEPAFKATLESLAGEFLDTKTDLTEENLQARIRGNILMAISNKFGHLVLATSNKSETAVGYATLYGDMCGGISPIKDIYKTEIYDLARWRNKNIPEISIYKKLDLIPENILTKAPTAELRENQKDSDSLPEYDILDAILYHLIEEQKSLAEVIKLGFEEKIVEKVAKLLHNSEYKRKQGAPGFKVSEVSFDKDRRYPVTNKFNN